MFFTKIYNLLFRQRTFQKGRVVGIFLALILLVLIIVSVKYPIQAYITTFWWTGELTELVISKSDFSMSERVILTANKARISDIQVVVRYGNGEKVDTPFSLTQDNDSVVVRLLPNSDLKPGKYSVEISSSKGTVLSKEFTWGVLVINTPKSVYKPGDQARVEIGILDELGAMVCDADIVLEVENQTTSAIQKFSTQAGDIVINPECQLYKTTENPDYEAQVTFSEIGVYKLYLSATTQNGSHSIVDYAIVKDNIDFDVSRLTATRIYPVLQQEVLFTIIPTEDFSGTIVETVPQDLAIFHSEKSPRPNLVSDTKTDIKTISWQVNWQKGKSYTLGYIYDAPNISPGLFKLGPLSFFSSDGQLSFAENRSWQVAVDATIVHESSTTGSSNANNTTFVVNTPSGTTDGDLLVATIVSRVTETTITAPSGWVQINQGNVASGPTLGVFYKVASGSEPGNYTFTFGVNSNRKRGGISRYSGVDINNPVDVSATINSGSNTSPVGSSVTTITDGAVLAMSVGWRATADTETHNPPTDMTERLDLSGVAFSDQTISTSGATGNKTATLSLSRNWSAIMWALRPAVTAGITVSGNAYNSGTSDKLTECDGATQNISLRADNVTYTTSCDGTTGAWTFTDVEAPSSGDGMVVWIDGESTKGALGIRYSGSGDSTGHILYSNTVVLTSDDATAISNSHLDVYDNANDSDIPYTISTNSLTVNSGQKLFVANNKTYSPGGTITISGSGNFELGSSVIAYLDTADSIIGGNIIVANGSTLNINANTTVSGGNITVSGTGEVTTNSGTPTTSISGDGTIGGTSSNLTFYNLSLSGTGTTVLNAPLVINNNLLVGDGSNSRILDIESNDNVVGVVGDVIIAGNGGNLQASSTEEFVLGGSWTNSGTFTAGTSTITLASNATGRTITSGGSAFYNLITNNASGGWTLQDNLSINNVLTIQAGTLNAGSNTVSLIGSGVPLVINGTFNLDTSTISYEGTNHTQILALNYYNLQTNPASGTPTYTFEGGMSSDWYNSNWINRKKITIDSTKVSGSSNLINFPILINLESDPQLATNAQSNGNDILFVDSNTGAKLDHEIEYFASSTGELQAWVRIPTLSATSNTEIYMYYGNSVASNQQNSTGVWDSNYLLVQHLQESPANNTSGHLDSTSNALNGTPQGFDGNSNSTTDAIGKIDGANKFDGIDDYVDFGNPTQLQLTGAMTASIWFKIPSMFAGQNKPNAKLLTKMGGSGNRGWLIRFEDWGQTDGIQCMALDFMVAQNGTSLVSSGQWYENTCASETWSTDWFHVTGVYLPENYVRLYVNGIQVSNTTTSLASQFNSSANVNIGRSTINADYYNGFLDEARVSNVARSSEWIATEYNNQSAPSTFYSLGGQETVGVGAGEEIIISNNFIATGAGSGIITASTNEVQLSVGASFSINSGQTFIASTVSPLTVLGNFSNTGTFTNSSGAVYLSGSNQTYTGSTTFYDLYITGTTARTVTFTGGSTVAITTNGSLTLSGNTSQLLALQSSNSNNWNLQVSETNTVVSVSHVVVSRSNAGGYKQIDASNGTNTNGGYNINWFFGSEEPGDIPTNEKLMRHGGWFDSSGIRKFFSF